MARRPEASPPEGEGAALMHVTGGLSAGASLSEAARELMPGGNPDKTEQNAPEHEIDQIIARLDVGIPEAHRSMDELLSRLRTTRIAA